MENGRTSRRQLIRGSAAAIGLAVLARARPAGAATAKRPPHRDPDAVLADLLGGNKRFVGGNVDAPRRRPEDFSPLAEGQSPEAVVIGCSDSRVPLEIVFDQGVGDLFVVRVAGNVVPTAGPIVKGSIEYAIAELGAPLILVLGHSQCGAVKAAIEHVRAKDALPGSIAGLVAAIRPAVIASQGKPGDALDNAIRANVEMSVARLKTLAPIVGPAFKRGAVKIVGGVYDLKSGAVTMTGT